MSEQFAVHRNPGRNRLIPFLVNVQSNRFRRSERRVVVPLVEAGKLGAPESDIGPRFIVQDVHVILDPLQITNVPRPVLGTEIGSLADYEEIITSAMDAMLSRAWGR